MEINVMMEYFDKLNDENAMFIEFKDGGQLLGTIMILSVQMEI